MKRGGLLVLLLFACLVSVGWAQAPNPPDKANPAIHGKGATDVIPVFTSPSTIGNSPISVLNGNVGIGTTGPTSALQVVSNFGDGGPTMVVGNSDPTGDVAVDFLSGGTFVGHLGYVQSSGPRGRFFIMQNGDLTLAEAGGNVGVRTTDPTNVLTVGQGAGHALADGWDTYSSSRWKTNIQPLDGALEKVNRLNGVFFNWKGTGKRDIGLVAEDVARVLPEVVGFENNGGEARSVDYGRLTALLVEAIKAQQNEITALKAEIDQLKPQK